MSATEHLRIAVIGKTDSVTTEIEAAWHDAQVSLQGPYSIGSLCGSLEFSCAIIDIRYDADAIFRLTELLDAQSIPYIFFVPKMVKGSHPGCFVLSTEKLDIHHIISALKAQGATRH
ncbi:hypothetical protein [Agrobacterium sp.]|jgi:hypothetical protein|uniref:hypothetical protein n=1 Tax=Agrobacterium sp. TaxID=361 RepID=UPI0028ABC7A0|nr:hypothetical protein [Agrobacterium sp.]